MKNAGKKLLLIGVGVLLGLLLAELALRVLEACAARRVPDKRYRETPVDTADIRLAVLGGSTSNGSPYSDVMGGKPGSRFNLLSLTRFLLERHYGCRAAAVDNYAGPNWSAETTVNHYFERPGYKPDVLVLYTGQNETTRYYSPNMTPPPAALSSLSRLKLGSLLLRRAFTSRLVPEDQRYEGAFFSDNVIPPYERAHNIARYRRCVESVIRHAAAEGIFLIVVIPQSNYLFPPTRSVYEGPARRKAEALRLFKQAYRAKYIENDAERALGLLEQLRGFCAFADLFFELGEYHYSRGEFESALPYLRRAREADGFPICITPAYREVLRELVDEHGVPHVDMNAVIGEVLNRPVPDYASFLDDCHLHPEVYLTLSREIIRVLRERGFRKLEFPEKELAMTADDWARRLGITPEVGREAAVWEASYHADQAGYTFLKSRSLGRAISYLRAAGNAVDTSAGSPHAGRVAALEQRARAERARLLRWAEREGPMPLGKTSAAMREGSSFRDEAGIEISQGNALFSHGEPAMAAEHYRAALELDPGNVTAHMNLGSALNNLRRFEEAARHYERALALDPRNPLAHRNLGNTLQGLGRLEDAVEHYGEALRIAPGDAATQQSYYSALNRLAWRLATNPDPAVRNGSRAVELAEELCRATGYKGPEALDTLAAAFAEAGRFADAAAAATRALELARANGSPEADAIAQRLEQYKARKATRSAVCP